MSTRLDLRLFGPPQLTWQAETITGFVSNKARALLIYLASTHCAHSRDTLAELLWSDTPASAKANLRRTLSNLRTLNGIAFRADCSPLVALDLSNCWVDVIEFEQLAHGAGDVDDLDALVRAAKLYHQDFLTGFNISLTYEFEAWALAEQTRLKGQMVEVLRRLADGYAQRNHLPQAIATVRRLLQLEPWREEAHRKLIEVLALNDDAGAALTAFESCRQTLRAELEVEPSAATLELVAKIRAGVFPGARPHYAGPSPSQRAVRSVAPTPVATPIEFQVEFQLVGRDREWQIVRAIWQGLEHPHFICIGGEAGIGKTRLAEELLLLAEQEGAPAARTRSHALQGQLAYGPIADWLRAAPLQSALAQLEDVWLTEIARLLPELLSERPTLPPPQPLQESWQRKRFFDALAHAFTAAFTVVDGRLLLVLDDLQWTDVDTLEWLQYLLERSEGRLLVIGTVRTDEIKPEHPLHRVRQELQRRDKLTELQLRPLNPAATTALAVQVATHELAGELAERLFHDTAGNPLFVIESMRATSTQAVDAADPLHPEQRAGDEQLPIPSEIPPKIVSVIQARLAQLSPQAQTLAQLGATIGRAFDVALLAQAAERDEEAVLLALDELWQRRIIREVDAVRFDFSHDRIRDVAYAEISPVRRHLLHRRVAKALEQVYVADLGAVSGQIAVHYEQAGLPEQAVDYYERAAEVAQQVYAHADATGNLTRGIALLERLPATPERLRQELRLQLALGISTDALKGASALQAKEIYERAQALAVQVGDDRQRFRALDGLFGSYMTRGQVQMAYDLALQTLPLAEQMAIPSRMLDAYGNVGIAAWHLGRLTSSRAYLEWNIGDREYQWRDAGGLAPEQHRGLTNRRHLAMVLWLLGYPDQGLAQIEETVTLAEALAHSYTLAGNLGWAAWLHQVRREPRLTQTQAVQAIALSREQGFRYVVARNMVLEGWAMAQQGQVEAGIARMQEAFAARQSMDAHLHQPALLALLAEAYALAGQPAQGLHALDEALYQAEMTSERCWDAELYRLQGELLRQQGLDTQMVEFSLSRGLAIARQQEAKSLELRLAMSLARLWQEHDKHRQAYDLLAAVYGWFTEGFETSDLVEAKALLAELQEHEKQSVPIRRLVS
jgi:predicted ATPase/DNA-binding SARP family transcriptional activator